MKGKAHERMSIHIDVYFFTPYFFSAKIRSHMFVVGIDSRSGAGVSGVRAQVKGCPGCRTFWLYDITTRLLIWIPLVRQEGGRRVCRAGIGSYIGSRQDDMRTTAPVLTDNESRAVPNVVDYCVVPIKTYQASHLLIIATLIL